MRRDLEKYIITLQKQLDGMQKAMDEANQLAKEGKMSEESAQRIINTATVVKSNYDRVLYCRYLLRLPPKFIQKLRKRDLTKQAKEFAKQKADEKAVKKENNKAIKDVKKEIKETKNADRSKDVQGDNSSNE